MSNQLTDQQKIDAVDELLGTHGEEKTLNHLKGFLFKIQGAYLFNPDDMGYPAKDAGNNFDTLYNFLDKLDPNTEGGSDE